MSDFMVERGIEEFVPPAVRELDAYTLTARTARDKLDQNESAFDLPDELKRVVLERVVNCEWNRYPDFETRRLRQALADRTGTGIENILVGNGSNELLMTLMASLVRPGRTVILPTPTFALYEKYARVFGGEVVQVSIDPRTGVLPTGALAMAAARSSEPPIVVVCSPNNPTGGVLETGDLDRLVQTGALVILDRAYGEFWNDRDLVLRDRVVVLSTFSKAIGIAGFRVGWMLADKALCREVRKVKLPYNLNVFSEELALAMLDRRDLWSEHVEDTIRERRRVVALLGEIKNVETFPTEANFVTFRVDRDADVVFDTLLDRDVLIRNVSGYPGLDRCLRVSIGTPDQNDRFLSALREAVK